MHVVCLIVAGVIVPATKTQGAVSDREIAASIARAVAYLKTHLQNQEGGRASLATLALLKAEVPADTPELRSALDKIAGRFSARTGFNATADHVYDAGVTLMALANADPRKYKREIETLVEYLIRFQGPNGDWDYFARTTGDTSISQYAILGLWEATRSGVKVPNRVWDKAAGWHITRQQRDGGFAYHPESTGNGFFGESTHTMTVAASASLLVARLHLAGDPTFQLAEGDEPGAAGRKSNRKKYGVLVPRHDADEPDPTDVAVRAAPDGPVTTRLPVLDRSVTNGRQWVSDRFLIDPSTGWKTYWLYGLERFAALAGIREIAGHNWYDEGADYLVRHQGPNGNWDDSCGPVAATSFGLMFLGKATEKMLNRPRRPDPRFGGGLLVGGRGLPDNLADAQLERGAVKVRKLKGSFDALLAELENVGSEKIESVQSSVVETIATENPEALIGQTDRLLRLARDKRVEVRRTALWALGRSNDLRIVPALIRGLSDADASCVVEAHNALRYISKRISTPELPETPTDAQRAQTIAMWRRWHQAVRPYEERDDLLETAKP